ncbi:MAG: sugar nucleotide-binding protein [Candidatus Omnitrophota bacterium]
MISRAKSWPPKIKKPATWLVVGGDGLIGRRLAVDATRFADRVVVSSHRPLLQTGKLFLDLAAGTDRSVLVSVAADVVFLCAAMTSMQFCHDNPDLSRQTNVNGTVRLASELVKLGCFIVFLSSNAVFDGNTEKPDEDSLYCPTTEYGRQKVSTEQQLMALSENSGSVAIVRLSKVLTSVSGTSAEFVKHLKAGEPCPAFDNLRLSPVSLSYVVDALLAVANARHPGIFHLSGAEEMTYADFARRLASYTGADPALVRPLSSESPDVRVLFRPEHPALGMRRTTKLLGITPEPTSHLLERLVMRSE